MLGLSAKTRIHQASTSELYGLVQDPPEGNHALLSPQPLRGGPRRLLKKREKPSLFVDSRLFWRRVNQVDRQQGVSPLL